ncbi:MAG: Sapep family Mn(2+)-dependent dipeptidase [Clostridiales bacterium]|nr:Sapep family Mn(2+)-dependent dipeptidase [Clostridiales bacterium]
MSEQEQANIDFVEVDRWLDEAYPQMERDLLQLLAIPTVLGEAAEGAPFGQALAQALDCSLQIAADLGLKTQNVDGYAGFADLPGQTKEQIGVLTHLDVVPASAEDWQTGPFEPVIVDGKLYARGTMDDKGPMIASLYAGIALARCGVSLNKTVRFLFGCNEESGMSCIRYFLQKHEPPSCGFSPDGNFPLVVGEKGLGRFSLCHSWQPDQGIAPLRLQSIHSGTAGNIVPDRAEAVFAVEGEFYFDGADVSGLHIAREGNNLRVSAVGKAAHASTPEEGENALVKLLQFLARQEFYPRGAKKYVGTLAKLFADTCYGETLGVADADEYSKLTVAPTILDVKENQGSLFCDMRFPITRKAAFFQEKLEVIAKDNGLDLIDWKGTEPLFAGEGSFIADTLLKAYRDHTGDMSEPLIIGGGTYAKTMPNFLAYGPVFPGAPNVVHQADEFMDIKEFMDSAKIYARAIYALAKS